MVFLLHSTAGNICCLLQPAGRQELHSPWQAGSSFFRLHQQEQVRLYFTYCSIILTLSWNLKKCRMLIWRLQPSFRLPFSFSGQHFSEKRPEYCFQLLSS
ncbi:Uncharacterised protein [Mycobacteroides abscessus subsp. abscessus]|nr:Uncharacterised protein [Mycobacteroides abscessus subsp. abscessus]